MNLSAFLTQLNLAEHDIRILEQELGDSLKREKRWQMIKEDIREAVKLLSAASITQEKNKEKPC